MVGAGRDHAEAPSSSARGARSSIPHAPLRRVLLDSMATPPGPSSSTAVPSRGQGKKKRGGGTRGRGRGGRVTLTAPSSPPPPAVSPEHVTARVDSAEEEAARTPVHEPPVHEPLVHGPSGHESSAHETPEEHTSGWGTWPDEPEGPSGHADDGGEPTNIDEEAGTVYQRGATRLPDMPATREQRWLIFPDGER